MNLLKHTVSTHTHRVLLAALSIVFTAAVFAATHNVYAGGTAGDGQGSSSEGQSCGNCQGTYSPGDPKTNNYKDNDGSGNLSSGDTVHGQESRGGGGSRDTYTTPDPECTRGWNCEPVVTTCTVSTPSGSGPNGAFMRPTGTDRVEARFKWKPEYEAKTIVQSPDGSVRDKRSSESPGQSIYFTSADKPGKYNITVNTKFGNATCYGSIRLVDTNAPQCSNGYDDGDSEDTLADAEDPGCHTDGDPDNPTTYDPNDNDETNTPPNLIAGLTSTRTAVAPGSPVGLRLSVKNDQPIKASIASLRTIEYRCTTCADTSLKRHSYKTRGTYDAATGTASPYTPSEWTGSVGFVPPEAGTYRIWFVVDTNNEVVETNENDNRASITIEADDTAQVSVSLNARKKTSDNSEPWRERISIRPGDEAELQLLPRNATSCDPDGFSISGETNRSRTIDLGTFTALGTSRYSVECAGPGGTDDDEAMITVGNITGPLELEADSPVRAGQKSELRWRLGGRTDCRIEGNGEDYNVDKNGKAPTDPILAETTYTISCTDDNASESAVIKVLPAFQEF